MRMVDLARKALAEAARTRLRAKVGSYSSLCIYDLCQANEVDVWFSPLPSLEGMYSPGDPPVAVVSALRPSGRQRMNCAHELGHHVFGHGMRLDQIIDASSGHSTFEPEELLANCFAEYLLMPKLAVLAALNKRAIDLKRATPEELLRVAAYFGVGYRTLIHHLEVNLAEIGSEQASALRRETPKAIGAAILGASVPGELVVADQAWQGRPIDLHVGDVLLVPPGTTSEGGRLSEFNEVPAGYAFTATTPGIGRVANDPVGWASFVRVARRVPGGGFVGRSIYRHEEDVDA